MINHSETIPKSIYQSSELFHSDIKSLFRNCWLHLGDVVGIHKSSNNLFPYLLSPGFLDEPILAVKGNHDIRLLSNVCTHRGFMLIQQPEKKRKIICGYHGRQFDNQGKVEFMPEFRDVDDFPRSCDHLYQFPMRNYSRFMFTSISPETEFDSIQKILDERLYFLNFDDFERAPLYDQIYNVRANWALYIDNYLEGFHIPFVHETLGNIIDYGNYETFCKEQVVLQIGYAEKGSPYFDLPEGHPDYGKKITAYYYWLFPNFMMNIYPWGVQTNIIHPIDVDFTKVEFQYYIKDRQIWEKMGKDEVAQKTEREDEYVVENVQKGLKSYFYHTGRYSPTRETGVYHFHQLIKEKISFS